MRVLLVEDDTMIGEAIQSALRDESYAVDWVKDGLKALVAVHAQRYDIMLLDLGLPGKDGQAVLKAIRSANNSVPALIVTARDALEQRLRGLDAGADDYILKPFDMPELLARMRAVLRRKHGSGTPVMSNGVVTLDPTTREAAVMGNAPTRLTHREYALLHALLGRPGALLSRSELANPTPGWGQEGERNATQPNN